MAQTHGNDGWQRLDARMVAVDVTRIAGSLIPLLVGVALRNADAAAAASTLTTLAAIGVVGSLLDLWRWSTTSYRVTDARVEMRSGVLNRRHRSMPRDRVRRVDATARVLHRVYGLAVVTIASGDGSGRDGDELRLDAVSAARAAELRRVLLGPDAPPGGPTPGVPAGTAAGVPRPPASAVPAAAPGRLPSGPGPTPTPAPTAPGEVVGEEVLASLRWGWARYAVLSLWVLAAPALALGAAAQGLGSIGVSVDEVVTDDRVVGRARDLSPVAAVAFGLSVALLVGVAAALLRFVETWWGFRLVREPEGRLRIHRGLLTARSISLDEARLRGVELSETMLLRAAGAGRLHAVTTGVGGDEARGERIDALMPAAPVSEVHRLAAVVLVEDRSPLDRAGLPRHPPAARRRRLVRAGAATAVTAIVITGLTIGGVPPVAWLALPPVAAAAVAWALDAYRGLGHAIEGRYLVARRGALVRRTVALQRAGVIGWTVRSTVFQRRSGLATVVATTAAGRGAYALVDVDEGDGLRVAGEAVPGLLSPFLTEGRARAANRAPWP